MIPQTGTRLLILTSPSEMDGVILSAPICTPRIMPVHRENSPGAGENDPFLGHFSGVALKYPFNRPLQPTRGCCRGPSSPVSGGPLLPVIGSGNYYSV